MGYATEIDAARFAQTGRSARPVVVEGVIGGSRADVFDAWTEQERMAEWMGVPVRVELRVGGPMEVYFAPDAPEGTRGSEGCQILGYIPDEVLVFSWNSPPTLPEIRPLLTQVAVFFSDHDAGTHVRLVHSGMGDEPVWDENRAYFDNAWPQVMAALQAYFE